MPNSEMISTALRFVLGMVFSNLLQHGIVNQGQLDLLDPSVIASAMATLLTMAYSVWKRRDAGLVSSAANVADTVIISPANADAIPKTNVVASIAEAAKVVTQ